jgi:hypothetical protein
MTDLEMEQGLLAGYRRELKTFIGKKSAVLPHIVDHLCDTAEAHLDVKRLTKALDEALSGPGRSAEQASLCDLVPHAEALRKALQANSDALRKCLTGGEIKAHEAAEALRQAAKWLP